MSGRVVLVGAGPGDPDLLTVRALREIQQAETLLYDALIPPVIVELAPESCECIDVGKRGDGSKGVPQDRIANLMVTMAQQGRHVVRLKGGDPFLFGRGGEETSALAEAGIPFEVVPGVSSALAVPAYAGIPLTDRRCASSIAVVTGHRGKSPEDRAIDWEGLARSVETLVILMGTAWIENIVERLIAGGRDPDTPAVAIASGTTSGQRVVPSRLCDLPRRIREEGLQPPTVIVIGEVAGFWPALQWYERRPLFGRRVLVLRARAQSSELSLLLSRAGAEPVHVPLLAFEGPQDPEPLAQALAALDRYDWLVFTSANAVRFCVSGLGAPRATGVRVACIGGATARAARAAGFEVEVVPEARSHPSLLVAQMAAGRPLRDARVLFPRAAGARDTLVRALEHEGARVDSPEAYRTFLPPGADGALRLALAERVDAALLTSPSTVDHLVRLLGEDALRDLAKEITLACIGPSTAGRLREMGIEPAVVCEQQSSAALVEALERRFAESPDGVS